MSHSNKELLMHILDEVRYVLKTTANINQDILTGDETIKGLLKRQNSFNSKANRRVIYPY